MKALYSLLRNFTALEISLIRSSLKGPALEGQSKYLQLFNFLVESEKLPSRRQASAVLYNAAPDTRITKVTVRLEERIQEIVMGNKFLRGTDRVSDGLLNRTEIRKQNNYIALLIGLVSNHTTVKLYLDRTIKSAEREYTYTSLLDLLLMRRSFESMNSVRYEYYTQRINYYRKCFDAEEIVRRYYFAKVWFNAYTSDISTKRKVNFLQKALKEIRPHEKFIISPRFKIVVARLRIDFLQYSGDFKTAISQAALAKKHAKLIPGGGIAYIGRLDCEIAVCYAFLGKFEIARQYLAKGLPILKRTETYNYSITLPAAFQIAFYSGQLEHAQKISDELRTVENFWGRDIRFTSYVLFNSCIAFKRNEFSKVLSNLGKTSFLNSDKAGYDLTIRILRIQSLLMLKKVDEASFAIHALRKHVSRYSKKFHLSPRYKLAVKIFLQAERRGFTGAAKKTELDLVEKLRAKKGEYAWQPFTSELIRFHEWYDVSPLAESK
jgi:hypothetical protein